MKKTEITTTHSTLTKSNTENELHQTGWKSEMHILTDNEVLSVAGGPEVDVESQGGGG
ncbi:hypothetical protein ACO0K9_08930 [Undibacterium sp. Ji50W]|uniref:hypothetical protein n=1 Tax=Undibacterium sp. Ji50W TaxID=3413041 RepID=UPI003BF33628